MTTNGADEQAGRPVQPATLTQLGGRIGRDALVYVSAGLSTLLFGLASVAVMTRLLDPVEFGHVAIYGVFTATLMVLFNLGTLQGTMIVVFGGGGDDEDAGIEDYDPDAVTTGDRRKALCTGILLTAGAGLLLCVPIAIAAPEIAPLLVRGDPSPALVRVSAAAAVLASLWRLTGNVARVERRPYAYSLAHTAHPVLTFAATVPLVAAGYGVDGAVVGLAVGNGLAFLVSLGVVHRSVRPGFSIADAKTIYRRGTPRMFVGLVFWSIANLDLYVVSRLVPASSVGLYRVGSRVGALTAHWTSAFNMAYGPLRREPLYQAAEADHGGYGVATAATYFVIATAGVVLGLGVFADVLVRIAASDYADAAPLIPVSAAAFAVHGVYILAYRLARFPNRYAWLTGGAVLALVVFLAASITLTPELGIYGPPVGATAGYLIATVLMVVLTQRSEHPVPYQWRRLVPAVLSAGAAYGAFRGADHVVPSLTVVWGVLALALYAAALVLTGALSRNAARVIVALVRALPQRWSRGAVQRRLAELDPADRALAELFARHRVAPATVAQVAGLSEEEALRDLVAVLRICSGTGRPGPHDADLARYLLWTGAPAIRDEMGRKLMVAGASPHEIHQLGVAFASLRQTPRSGWASDGVARRRRRGRVGTRP